MLKFVVLALICAQALGEPKDVIIVSDTEDAKSSGENEPGVEIFTIPFPTPSNLGLTTGDLKVFSGHALNLLKSKCPNVDPKLIFSLQKFIAKQIAKNSDPIPGDNHKFREVLKTVTTCAATVTPRASAEEPIAAKRTDAVPAKKAEKDEFADLFKSSEEDTDSANAKSDEVKLIPIIPVASPLSSSDWKSKWSKMSSAEKKGELSTIYNANSKQAQAPIAKKTPVSETTVRSTSTSAAPKLSIMATPPKDEKKHSNPIISWFNKIFDKVSSFFKNMFGLGGRRRRAANPDDDSAEEEAVAAIRSPAKSGRGKFHAPGTRTKGQQAFVSLISGICQVYCDKCNKINLQDFKLANQELIDYLFTHISPTGIELAAANYLTPELLDEISKCTKSN